jgi:hypothetical protein
MDTDFQMKDEEITEVGFNRSALSLWKIGVNPCLAASIKLHQPAKKEF